MRNSRAEMFNRKAADSRPEEVLKSLGLKRGWKIADIGSGGGYYSMRFAEVAGKEGMVYAVDINPDFLDFIKMLSGERGIRNVKTILAGGKKPELPESGLDLIFMRNVYHHLENRVEYLRGLSAFLKDGGKIAIIEHMKKGFNFHSLFGHNTSPETIGKEMKEAGYGLEKRFDFLPGQSFAVFRKITA